MKKVTAMIGVALLFYCLLFFLQLALYFFNPSFYVGSPTQLKLPGFIGWTFAKYFGLIFLLYLAWGLLLGAWNGLILFLNQPRWVHKSIVGPGLLLSLTQFLGTVLYLGYLHPSAFQLYPILQHLPLILSYTLLAAGMIFTGFYFLRSRTQKIFRGIPQLALSVALPVVVFAGLHQESRLRIEPASDLVDSRTPDILLIGIDALDGDSGNEFLQKHLSDEKGMLFTNAFTPLPLTHPAWNSILTGLYPRSHGVRYFFDSPLASKDPELSLPKILLREKNYLSLFASDQPETSYFTREAGFSGWIHHRIGWEAHMVVSILNQFVLPALWLNNSLVENWTEASFNYAGLFNFDLNRFFSYAFENFSELGPSPKFLAFHTCALHSPIRLNLRELQSIPRYWALAPADFSFARWPRPGWPQQSTSKDWINPYFIRRHTVLEFLEQVSNELQAGNYFKNNIVVFLSDHGERFIKDREIYGGVHGVDILTREQNNVVLTILDPLMAQWTVRSEPVSLIDLTPTLMSRLGIPTENKGFDGIALLNGHAKPRPLPGRPLWVESMGFIDDHMEKNQFPEFNLKSLEESLRYGVNGSVKIDEDYYQRILLKKETADLSITQR